MYAGITSASTGHSILQKIERDILFRLLNREGGYVNDASDRGGATKFGITAKTLGSWLGLGEAATPQRVSQLTAEEALDIYYAKYMVEPGISSIKEPLVLELVVDAAAHSGVTRSVKWLQRALDVPVDGVLGPVTQRAVESSDVRALCSKLLTLRLKFLGRLIAKSPDQAKFASGWLKRIAELITLTLA